MKDIKIFYKVNFFNFIFFLLFLIFFYLYFSKSNNLSQCSIGSGNLYSSLLEAQKEKEEIINCVSEFAIISNQDKIKYFGPLCFTDSYESLNQCVEDYKEENNKLKSSLENIGKCI